MQLGLRYRTNRMFHYIYNYRDDTGYPEFPDYNSRQTLSSYALYIQDKLLNLDGGQ